MHAAPLAGGECRSNRPGSKLRVWRMDPLRFSINFSDHVPDGARRVIAPHVLGLLSGGQRHVLGGLLLRSDGPGLNLTCQQMDRIAGPDLSVSPVAKNRPCMENAAGQSALDSKSLIFNKGYFVPGAGRRCGSPDGDIRCALLGRHAHLTALAWCRYQAR